MEDKKQVVLVADRSTQDILNRVEDKFGTVQMWYTNAVEATMAILGWVRDGTAPSFHVVSTVRLGNRPDGGVSIYDTLTQMGHPEANLPEFTFFAEDDRIEPVIRGYIEHRGRRLVSI